MGGLTTPSTGRSIDTGTTGTTGRNRQHSKWTGWANTGFTKSIKISDWAAGYVNAASHKLGSERFWPSSGDYVEEIAKCTRILNGFTQQGFVREEEQVVADDDPNGKEVTEEQTLGPDGEPLTKEQAAKLAPSETRKQKITKKIKKVKIIRKIPPEIIKKARGIAIYTSMRSGMAPFGGSGGSGLVMARLPDGSWSAPSFITPQNASAGLMFGLDVYDVVLLVMSETALEGFKTHKVTLGAETAIAAGPVGTGAAIDMSVNGVDWTNSSQPAPEGEKRKIAKPPAPLLSYTRNRGFYAGFEGMAMVYLTRFDENERVYHWPGLTGRDVLEGRVRKPVEAQPLYDALYAAETGQAQATVSDLRLPKELDNSSLAALSHQSSSTKLGAGDPDSGSITDSTHDGSSSIKTGSGSDESQSTQEGPLVLDDGEKLHLPPTPEQLDFMEQAGIRDEEDERLEAEHKAYIWSLPEPPRHPAALRRSEGITRTKAGHRFVAPTPLPGSGKARFVAPGPPPESKAGSLPPLQRTLSQESTGTLKPNELDPPPAYSPGPDAGSSSLADQKAPLQAPSSPRGLTNGEGSTELSSEPSVVKGEDKKAIASSSEDVIAGSTSVNAAVAMNLKRQEAGLTQNDSSDVAFEEAVEVPADHTAQHPVPQEATTASKEATAPQEAAPALREATSTDQVATTGTATEETSPTEAASEATPLAKDITASEEAAPLAEVTPADEKAAPEAEADAASEDREPTTPTKTSANFPKGSVEEDPAQNTPTLNGDKEPEDKERSSEAQGAKNESLTIDTDPATIKKDRRKTATELLLDTMWKGRSGSPAPGLGLLPGEESVSTPVGRSHTPSRLFAQKEGETKVPKVPEEEASEETPATGAEHHQKIAVPVARRDSLHLGTDDDDLDENEETQLSRDASESGPSTRHSVDAWRPDYDTDEAEESTTDAFAMLSRRFSTVPSALDRAAEENGDSVEGNEPERTEHARTHEEVPSSAAPTPAPRRETDSDADSNDEFAEAESIDHHVAVAEPIPEDREAEEEEPKAVADESKPEPPTELPVSKTPEPTQPAVETPKTFSRPKRNRPMSAIVTPERPTTPGTPTTPSTPVAGGAPLRPQRSASRALRPPRSSARPTSMIGPPTTPSEGEEPQA